MDLIWLLIIALFFATAFALVWGFDRLSQEK